jgi:hypothetical protein
MRFPLAPPCLAAGLVFSQHAQAWIIQTVGPGKQYPRISAAVAAQASSPGHSWEIDVQAGTYLNDFAVITNPTDIEAKGGPVILDATVPPPNEASSWATMSRAGR